MTQENCLKEIERHINLINDALSWGNEFRGDDFPASPFKKWRRELKKMHDSLSAKCSAAAYGESQVGKSYLVSSLLSSPGVEFKISGNGKNYDFKTEINSSASTNAEVEATGIVTRFTVKADDNGPKNMIKVKNLSVVDLVLMLVDSFYNDIKINSDIEGEDSELDTNDINEALRNLSPLWKDRSRTYNIIDEDDIWDIQDYIRDILGNKASAVRKSNFAETIAPVIKYVPIGRWVEIFELLWNKNREISRLFETLINAYDKLNFQREVYLPFDAVLYENGTILKVQWLDTVCASNVDIGKDTPVVDVYDRNGELLAKDFPKGELSALISELTFEVGPEYAKERLFFNKMDLMDFPGARSRKQVHENEIEQVIPKILRRGKVAYLFNKYSRDKQISSLLFCHHNNQLASGGNLGDTVTQWIKENIGEDPEKRTKMMNATKGVSPFFFIATKFNRDLEKLSVDNPQHVSDLDNHWERFNKVIPEIVEPAPWLEKWSVNESGIEMPFSFIFPLRDFEHSAKAGLFKGYSPLCPGETEEGSYPDFPNYMEELRKSFFNNAFVKRHFKNPAHTWQSVATVNNDGSKEIIKALSEISDNLDNARYQKYHDRLLEIRQDMLNRLSSYYEPADTQAQNQKVKTLAGFIRQDLTRMVSKNPVAFGKIMEKFMIEPEELRNIAYNIILRHTESPEQFSPIDFILVNAGVNLESDTREQNIQRLIQYLGLESEEKLRAYLAEDGIDLDDMLSKRTRTITTVAELVTHRIASYWKDHLDKVASELNSQIPHAAEISDMLKRLFTKLDMIPLMSRRIQGYVNLFSDEEQPNVIGDFASLTLNKFVTSVGREFIDDNMIPVLQEKAALCDIKVNISPKGWDRVRKPQSLADTLEVFDKYASIINNPGEKTELLNQLPFWSNYQRWENFLMLGLLYAADISNVDPVANGKMGDIINNSKSLYA